MPAVSFSEFDATIQRTRESPSPQQRQAAVNALLDFARSGRRAQQLKAAQNIPECYELCVDHRRTVQDAVFDLCEDSKEEIRIAGYRTIVELSRRFKAPQSKDADVLCQLLQTDAPQELEVVRACLSEHIRIAPETTLTVISEYLVTTVAGKPCRGSLMNVLISFLAGGGYSEEILPTNTSSHENQLVLRLRQRDCEGGLGPILEISWVKRSPSAESILREGLIRALPFVLDDELKPLTETVLFSLRTECEPLSPTTYTLLNKLVQVAKTHIRDRPKISASDAESVRSSLRLCGLVVMPASPPPNLAEDNTSLPRAHPLPLLQYINESFLQFQWWNKYPEPVRGELIRVLGVCLDACCSIAELPSEPPLVLKLKPNLDLARDRAIDLAFPLTRDWIDSSGLSADLGASQGIHSLLNSIKNRVRESDWKPNWDQAKTLQDVRKCASTHIKKTQPGLSQQLIKTVDNILAKPQAVVKSLGHTKATESAFQTNPGDGSDVTSKPRKRSREEHESHGSIENILSSGSGEPERNTKKQKLNIDLLAKVGLTKPLSAPAVSSSLLFSPLVRIPSGPQTSQPPPPTQDAISNNIKGANNTHVSFKSNNNNYQTTVTAPHFSIKGAAIKKSYSLQTQPESKVPSRDLKTGSIPPLKGTEGDFTPQLSLAARMGNLAMAQTSKGIPPKQVDQTASPAAPSLLIRLSGGAVPPPVQQASVPASSIFDRMGIPQTSRGQNVGGGRRKRG